MKYVFDNNTLVSIFKHYYFANFPSFWNKFNPMVLNNDITSVKEVKQELKGIGLWNEIKGWASSFPYLFDNPTNRELDFITTIYRVKHFQQNIGNKQLLAGRPVADPFIIAKAKINGAIVITQEVYRPNAARIPNICRHFGIGCDNLKGFLNMEKWKF